MTTEAPKIRPFKNGDTDEVLALNAANTPEVGPLDEAKLRLLTSEAALFEVVEVGGLIAGALVILVDGGTYSSPNYQWFSNRYPDFAYVDRVMLTAAVRGTGVGVRLYENAAEAARAASKPVLCCEVNTRPLNARSLRFHQLFGFTELERLEPYDDDTEVAMLQLAL